jgi:hypothetical protein
MFGGAIVSEKNHYVFSESENAIRSSKSRSSRRLYYDFYLKAPGQRQLGKCKTSESASPDSEAAADYFAADQMLEVILSHREHPRLRWPATRAC